MEIPGITHRETLRDLGAQRRDLARWVRRGVMTSQQPWYLTAKAPKDLAALLRLGVRPTCLDAAALHGLWVPLHEGTHVFRPRSRDQYATLRGVEVIPLHRRDGVAYAGGDPQGLVFHYPEPRAWPNTDPVPDLGLVLLHAGHCLPPVKTAVLFESALNRGLLSVHTAEQIVGSLPLRARRPLSRLRTDAESGTETTVR